MSRTARRGALRPAALSLLAVVPILAALAWVSAPCRGPLPPQRQYPGRSRRPRAGPDAASGPAAHALSRRRQARPGRAPKGSARRPLTRPTGSRKASQFTIWTPKRSGARPADSPAFSPTAWSWRRQAARSGRGLGEFAPIPPGSSRRLRVSRKPKPRLPGRSMRKDSKSPMSAIRSSMPNSSIRRAAGTPSIRSRARSIPVFPGRMRPQTSFWITQPIRP